MEATMTYFGEPRSQTYLKADLADMLRAVARAGMGPSNRATSLRQSDYNDGFRAAIEAMALAIGLGAETGQRIRIKEGER
jgi:hypothetical protein